MSAQDTNDADRACPKAYGDTLGTTRADPPTCGASYCADGTGSGRRISGARWDAVTGAQPAHAVRSVR
jgi:hypothetical protein